MRFRLPAMSRPRTSPPTPPESLLAAIGPGDFWGIGHATVELIDKLIGIGRSDVVLDIGCGLGRIAWPLSARLGRRGRYTGFDVQKLYVDWCTEHLGLPPERFTFRHADLRSTYSNPVGPLAADSFVFPWPDRTFTLAIATSLFTHLLPATTAHYLREIHRTLRPGGHLFGSFFLADEAGLAAIRSGKTYPVFTTAIEHGWLHDPAAPEKAVAHDPAWLEAAFDAAGLQVLGTHAGTWKTATEIYYQDVVVARRG